MFRLHLSWLLVHFFPLFAEHIARVDVQPAAAEQALASQQATGRHGQTNPLPAGALARIQTARPGHEAAVTCVAFAPRGLTLASTSFDEALSLWDPATGKELRRITGHPKLASAAFSPDGQTVASAGWDGTIRLWQADTGRPFRSLRAQGDRVLAIAFSPNGKLIASGEPDAPLSLWDTATGNRVRGLTSQVSSTFVLAFSPDGKLLASSTFQDQAIQLWEVDTGKPVRRLESPGSFASCFAFSSDGKSLVSGGSNGQLILWEVATAGVRLRFGGRRSAIQCLAISPDGRTMVSGHEDGLIWVWDTATGKECCRLGGHRAAVRSAAFAPAGALLASGSADMTVLVWSAPAALPERTAPAKPVSATELAAWWNDLAHDDASRAYRAVLGLAAVPEHSVPFLRQAMRRLEGSQARTTRLLADLDDNRFAVRQKASNELKALGRQAEPALRAELRRGPSPEVNFRVEQLLKELPPADQSTLSGEQARALRTLEILERSATPAARQLLATLAADAPDLSLRQEARAALERLTKRPAAVPESIHR